MRIINSIKASLRKIPGLQESYGKMRNSVIAATVPALKFLLKFNCYTYDEFDVTSRRNTEFLTEPDYIKAYEAANKQGGWGAGIKICWTMHVNQWAAFHAKQLCGDFVECGVWRGGLSMSNIVYIDFKSMVDRKYYLFDTFCGLDKGFSTQKEFGSYRNAYEETHDFVVKSFKDWPNVIIVRGAIPKTLAQVDIKEVAFLHIDMNCVLPEVEAIKFFWPKLVAGGIVILDDYAHVGHENQKKAMDEFASSQGVKILSLPTGQGFLIKPRR